MRALIHVTFPNEPFNSAVRKGTAGDSMKRILDEHKTSPQIKPGTFVKPSASETEQPEAAAEDSPRRESADGA